MQIKLNEKFVEITDGTTTEEIKKHYKPNADIIIVNGWPTNENIILGQNDTVSLICRGQIPQESEMEALMVARHSPGVHQKLKKAVVGIAGLGGLGSAIAIALARTGVGSLILADFDVVEPSNLNRQQYFTDQIGMAKTEALRDNLLRINPYVNYQCHNIKLNEDNIVEFFAGVDVMVEAFDNPTAKAMIMETFQANFRQKTLIMASGLAGYEPSNSIKTRKLGGNLVIVGDGVSAAGQGFGLMAPRVGIAAGHQANAVLRILMGKEAE